MVTPSIVSVPQGTGPPSAVDEQPTPKQRQVRRRQGSLSRGTDAAARWYHFLSLADCAKSVSEPFGAARASTRDEPVNLSDSCRKLIRIWRQPVPIAASRYYLIQMLG